MHHYSKNKVLKILNNICRNFFKPLFFFILLCCVSSNIYSQQKNKQPQIITVGIYHNPPLEDYVNGQAIGLYPTLLNEIAKKNNWKLKYVFGTWNEVYEGLLHHKIDLLTNIIYLPERDSLVDFNKETVLAMWTSLFAPEGINIKDLSDLNFKKIGVLKGGANGIWFKRLMDKFNYNPVYNDFKDYESIAKAIEKKQIYAGVFNNLVGHKLADTYNIHKSTLFLNPNRLLFAVKKGYNGQLLKSIDAQLKLWEENPNSVYHKAIDKWITNYNAKSFTYKYIKWLLLIILGVSLLVLSFIRTIKLSQKKAILNYKSSIKELTIKEEEKQKIQSKLYSTENYLQTIFDSTSDAIFIHDGVTGEIVDVNQQMCKMFGYKKEEVLHKTMDTFSSGNPNYTEKEAIDWMMRAKNDGVQTFEWQSRHKDGTIFWTEVSLKIIELLGKWQCLATVRNIQEQIEAKYKQNKANRLFDTLSQISLAVASNSDKKSLLQEICDITTKNEHFKLTWIGFVDTKNQLIKPLVFSGEDAENLLADFEISLTDEKLAKGPTCRALSEKKSIIINDVLTDGSYQPWRKKAKELGYRSFISLPIFHHNEVVGTLNIDTDQYSIFDASEVTLLEKITLNISIAIEKFEQEENRLKIEAKLQESYQIINRSPAVAFLWEKEAGWPVEYVSENVQELTGYSTNDFLTQKISYFDIIYKDDIERVTKEVATFSEDKKSTTFKHKPYRILTKSGNIKWISDNSVIRRNEKHEITHFEGLIIDITENKLAEQKVYLLNNQLVKAGEVANLGFIDWNFETNEILLSEEAKRMYQMPDDEKDPIGFMNAAIHPDDVKKSQEGLELASKGLKKYDVDIRVIRKDKSMLWLNAKAELIKDKKGKDSKLLGTILNITERKKIESKLFEKNQLLEKSFKSTPLSFIYLDINSNIQIWNSSAENIFGYTEKEAIGKNLVELITPKNLQKDVTEICHSVKNKPGGKISENNNITKSGKIITCKWHNSEIVDENNNVIGLASLVEDITERKLAENMLKENEQQMTSIYNTVEDVIFYLKVEKENVYRFDSVNKAFLTSIGVEKQHVEGKFVHEIIPEPSLSLVLKKYKEAIEKKETVTWEETTTYPIGTKIGQVTIAPIFNDNGVCTNIVGSVHDITEIRMQSKELIQLNDELKLLHKVSQKLSGTLNLKDLSKQALVNLQEAVNPDMSLFYLLQEEVLKLVDYHFETVDLDLTYEKSHHLGQCLCGLAASTKKSIFSEDIFNDSRCTIDSCKNAGIKSFIGVPLISENKVLGVIGLGFSKKQDFTKNKNFIETFIFDMALGLQNVLLLESLQTHEAELETKIKESTKELAHSNRELRDFAQIVSHDLKAPLRAISQLSFWLSKDYADKIDEEGQEQLKLLIGRVQRLDNLIEGILQFSRIGKTQEKEVEINLNNLVEDIIELLSPPENIQVKIDAELPIITADPTRMGQLFQNLIQNAIKFMDKPKGFINIGVCEQENFYEFYVKDNGCGIDNQYFDRIFKIFQRLVSRDEKEGTGIGLSLVKRIAQIYGGDVWLTSKLDEGTTFYVTLPKNQKK